MSDAFEAIAHPDGSNLSPFHRARLANGIVLIVREMPRSPAAYVSIWCRAGSAHEDPRLGGIAHFLEHMFFKGTARYGPGEMDRIIKGLGGDNNASTALEYTSYVATVPAESHRTALDVLCDALRNSLFDPEEIERERQVVLEEIGRRDDDPGGKVFLEFQTGIGGDTPYARAVLGTAESLARVDQDAFRRHLAERYTGANLCVVVSGRVGRQAVRAAVEEGLGGIAAGERNRIPEFEWSPVPPGERRVRREVGHAYLILGFRTPGLCDLQLSYDLEVLAAILGEGRSSRLGRRLREELGIVTSISAWTWDLGGGGTFAISATMEPGLEARVREEIAAAIRRLHQGPIDPAEVERAVTMLRADHRLSTETAADVGEALGFAEVTAGAEEALRYADRLRAVTPARVQAAARAWLMLDHMVAATVCPRAESPEPA